MAVLCLPPGASAAGGFEAVLETFSGEWEGELRVHALDGFLLKTFPAHRYYSWDGAAQVVVTRFFDGSSDYETKATQHAAAGRLSSTVTRPGQASEEYVGALEAGTVVWTNSSNNKRDYSERLVTTNGVTRLETTSSEIMRVKGVSGVVRVSGSFQRTGATPSAGARPSVPDNVALNDRIAELQRELADARRARENPVSATQSGAATPADLVRERDALRARVAALEAEQAALTARAADAPASAARIAELEQAANDARRSMEAAKIAAITETGQAAQLRERVATLEGQLRGAEAALSAARAGAAETDTRDRLAKLEHELHSARSARDQAAAQAASLADELAAVRAEVDQMRAGTSAESVRIQQLERDLAAAQNTIVKYDEATRGLQTELADARRRAVAATEELERARAEAAAAADQLTQTRGQAETIERKATDAAAETVRLAGRVKELEAAAAAAESARLTATTTAGDAARDQAALREQIVKLQSDLEATRAARSQLEKDNAAASSSLVATRDEAERLAARVKDLEVSMAAAGSTEQERADLRQQVSALASAAEASKAELAKVQTERDALAARVATLAARPDISADALAAERRQTQERLNLAESSARNAAARLADAEKQLAESRASAARADSAVASLDELRGTLAAAQADATAARQQVELIQSERDLLAFRLKGTDEAAAEHASALRAAETAVTEARHRADVAEGRLKQLENAGAAIAELRVELETQRSAVATREQENNRLVARIAEIESERETLRARVTDLEQAATAESTSPTFRLASAPPASATQREEIQTELARLQRHVTELESERNSIRDTQLFLQGQLDQARQLRDDTLARFQDVVAQLDTMREERDRLARSNASLQSELRVARSASGPPATAAPAPAAPPTGGSPSFLDRLLGYSEPPKSAAPAAVASDDEYEPPLNPVIQGKISALQVIGITRAAEGDKVILNGRLYRSGDIIDPSASIVFERIDGDALIFSDANGREYRRRF